MTVGGRLLSVQLRHLNKRQSKEITKEKLNEAPSRKIIQSYFPRNSKESCKVGVGGE